MNKPSIRVKLISRCHPSIWLRQLPTDNPTWGNCTFVFDLEEQNYDWLVVYDELPRKQDATTHPGVETLACAQRNTLLVTSEPSTIKSYHKKYTGQFGWILTSQAEWALPHPDRIHSQPALRWFYGAHRSLDFNQLKNNPPTNKTGVISTVSSNKQQRHTLHHRRYHFVHDLKGLLPELELFGKGIRPILDKSEALDAYKYHIAIENFHGPHHWTEKLADAFLGGCLPFYAGCPNAADYFPPESFIPIDINDTKGTAQIIRDAIDNDEYKKRLPHILEARRRVIEEYNLFAVLSREIETRHASAPPPKTPVKLYGRKALRRNPAVAIQDGYARSRLKLMHWLKC
jgi:hypothetical protein